MNLPTLQKNDLPRIFNRRRIEVRNKSDARVEHWPILAFAWLVVTISGREYSEFQQGLPVLFSSSVSATYYTHAGLDAEDVRFGSVSTSDMPGIVHELTHCFRWIRIGYIRTAFTYVLIPAPVIWTGRATEEFIAESNEMLWLYYRYRPYSEYMNRLIRSSADVFTSSTYLWPTLDRQGWKDGLRQVYLYGQSEDRLDAIDAVPRYGIHHKFSGYLIEG